MTSQADKLRELHRRAGLNPETDPAEYLRNMHRSAQPFLDNLESQIPRLVNMIAAGPMAGFMEPALVSGCLAFCTAAAGFKIARELGIDVEAILKEART